MEEHILTYMTAFNKPPIQQGIASGTPIGYGQQNAHMPHQVFPHVNAGYGSPLNIISGNNISIGTAGSIPHNRVDHNANYMLYNKAENASNMVVNKGINEPNMLYNKAQSAGNMVVNKGINEPSMLYNKAENSGNMVVNKGINEPNMLYNKARNVTNSTDEDDPRFPDDCDSGSALGANRFSTWQRMKWTDSMVKLMMNIVVHMGEEEDPTIEGSKKRKPAFLHKKGKWKSISQIMNDKSFYVSPQQCEDKFNDLNKRYKKLNDILGNELAWSVVENPSLLNDINTISSKAKEDVRKILSSKHLFYKEMCLYHKEYIPSMEPPSSTTVTQGLIRTNSMEVSSKISEHLGGEDDNDKNHNNVDSDPDKTETKSHIIDFGTKANVAKRRKLSWLLPNSSSTSAPLFLKAFGGDSSLYIKQMMLGYDDLKSVDNKQLIMMLLAEERKVWLLAESLRVCKQQFKWHKLNCKKQHSQEQHQLEMIREKLVKERASLQMKIDMNCRTENSNQQVLQ